jgi:SNF2 family DNA or RNA helicase
LLLGSFLYWYMEIYENKILKFRTRQPEKYSIIPKCAVVGEQDGIYELAVKWALEECIVLKNLGVRNIPSPIKREYNWPAMPGIKPMSHQIETASFLTMHNRAFCFNDPGTGKTLSCLWAADYLMNKGLVRRVLILCPLSIMNVAWMDDISKSVIHRSAAIAFHPAGRKRLEVIKGGYEIVVSNYDGLNIVAGEIVKDGTFDLIIADEANAYKNPKTMRWKALNSILRADTRVWMLTGTPAPQSPVDAYGLAKIVNPSGVPHFATSWRDKVLTKVSQFRWIPRPDAPLLVHNALQPAIRYTKAQCLDLPPVVTLTREVPMTPQQEKYYKEMKKEQLFKAAGEVVTAQNAAITINKLLQISSGAVYTDERMVVDFDCRPRLTELLEIIEDTERKIIVFVPFKHSIDKIKEFLDAQKIDSIVIDGSVSLSARTENFGLFQRPDSSVRVAIIQPQSAAHGVTLTAADTVVFWGPVSSVETYVQCIARADRHGQTSDKVTVIHLQTSDVERKLYKQLQSNITNHNAIIELYNEVMESE